MKKIYFTTIEKNVIDNFGVSRLALMHDAVRITSDDFDALRSYAASCDGIIREVENPSVEYLLRNGHRFSAYKVFRDKHPDMNFAAVKVAIDRIEEKMEKRKNTAGDSEEAPEA